MPKEEYALMEIEAQNIHRISVIEVTFEDGSSDTIELIPDEKPPPRTARACRCE